MPGKYQAKQPKWDKEHIQALRQHLGLTQQEMAAELGTRQQTISEWETGMYRPRGASSTLLFIIAEKAGFKYDEGADVRPDIRP
jgi:DNA-binding transcriptional regulator YiaG